ncbi:hypothetical protein [Aeromonas dhakensis]|nr:hypothetical protein VAWG005_41730 [Aeromonas dhakensis]
MERWKRPWLFHSDKSDIDFIYCFASALFVLPILLENKALILNGLFLNVDVTIFHHHGDMKDGWIYKTEHF